MHEYYILYKHLPVVQAICWEHGDRPTVRQSGIPGFYSILTTVEQCWVYHYTVSLEDARLTIKH